VAITFASPMKSTRELSAPVSFQFSTTFEVATATCVGQHELSEEDIWITFELRYQQQCGAEGASQI